MSSFRPFLPPQFRSCLHVGGDFLAQRLDALAVQGVLPAFGRLLELPCAKPPSLRARMGMEGDQIRPETTGLHT
jgi:hypothetical protein